MRKHLDQNLFLAVFLQDLISLGLNELHSISRQSVNKSLGNYVFFSSVTLSQQLQQSSFVSKNVKPFTERHSQKRTHLLADTSTGMQTWYLRIQSAENKCSRFCSLWAKFCSHLDRPVPRSYLSFH